MTLRAAWTLAAVFTLPFSAALAHHPVAAKFDEDRPLTLSGVLTHVDWANPHVHLFVKTSDEPGERTWAVELASTVELEWSGWTPESLPVGARVTVEGLAARDGSEQLWGVEVRDASGERVFEVNESALAARLDARPQGAAPRSPDGRLSLGPPQGQTGYWMKVGGGSLVEEGVEVEMDAHGLLRDLADAPRVAPLQDWALNLYLLRQGDALKNDPLFLHCIPPGGPRQFQIPYGVQFVEQRERQRIFVLMGGGNSNWRLIYTDGREPQGQVGGNDDNPLFYGRSAGRWEGDTLVVETSGFNETFWFSNGGLPHTSLLRLEERFTRDGLNTLRYEVTVNDPGAYTRPWTSSWNLEWVAGEELPEFYCQDNRP